MSSAPSHTFRTATHADIDAVVSLVTSAYRGESSRAGWTNEADYIAGSRTTPAVVRADIDRPGSRILLLERDGELVACAHVADDGDAGHFGMFAVQPPLQGGGIGKLVLAEAERIARGARAGGHAAPAHRHPRGARRVLRAPRIRAHGQVQAFPGRR